MTIVLRILSIIALTVAMDVIGGSIGFAVSGERGLKTGMDTSGRLCFAWFATVVVLRGWRATWSVLTSGRCET